MVFLLSEVDQQDNKTSCVVNSSPGALLELRLIVVQLFVESNQSENDETSNPISLI